MSTTLVHEIAGVAHAAANQSDPDLVRTRLLGNLAAAMGDTGELPSLGDALGRAETPGDVAHRIALAMHARTQDDFYPAGRSHLGAVAIPAAIAVGTTDMHRALAGGYEVMARISEAYCAEAQDRGWRPTGVFGPMGAAVSAALGLGLGVDETANAIALASSACGGTNQSWLDGSDEWLLEVGVAARAGVEAALLARAGVKGAPYALEGPAGWAAATFEQPGAAALTAALEDDSPRLPLMALKKFPLSGIAQAPTAAACRLGELVDQPTSIEVRMNPAEAAYPGSVNRGPFTSRGDALMSVALCVVVGLRSGRVTFSGLVEPLSSGDQRLLDELELVGDDTLAETDVVVRVTDADGSQQEVALSGGDLLYPGWSELSAPGVLTAQFELDDSSERTLVQLVSNGAPAWCLRAVLAERLPKSITPMTT